MRHDVTGFGGGNAFAGVYREKASGARADRPELLHTIADLAVLESIHSKRR
jgi:hypothetical protein